MCILIRLIYNGNGSHTYDIVHNLAQASSMLTTVFRTWWHKNYVMGDWIMLAYNKILNAVQYKGWIH